MRTKISAIIIDPLKKEHDYREVISEIGRNCEDKTFDLKVFTNTDDIIRRLHDNRGFDAIITLGNNINFTPLNALSFEFRKKWVHLPEYEPIVISRSIINVFMCNINRGNKDSQVFSIFTCAYNTPKEFVNRLYKSLCNQTYDNWNWWIIDDSEKNKYCYFTDIQDPRVHVIKNVTDHGNIGFNKHLIASACDGDYLVEIDHDDELTPDCLYLLKKAFDTYPDTDFVYSYALEEIGGRSVWYGDYFALGLGTYEKHDVNGVTFNLPTTPNVNALSVRHIVGLPNHVRCWKKEFYHSIGGHNIELSVLDDMDILIRTFLHGKMCKIPKVLYIQHEGEDRGNRREGSTTQSKRFDEIQRTGEILKWKYDKEIHERLLSLGVSDPYWVEDGEYSIIFDGVKDGTINLNYILED